MIKGEFPTGQNEALIGNKNVESWWPLSSVILVVLYGLSESQFTAAVDTTRFNNKL